MCPTLFRRRVLPTTPMKSSNSSACQELVDDAMDIKLQLLVWYGKSWIPNDVSNANWLVQLKFGASHFYGRLCSRGWNATQTVYFVAWGCEIRVFTYSPSWSCRITAVSFNPPEKFTSQPTYSHYDPSLMPFWPCDKTKNMRFQKLF